MRALKRKRERQIRTGRASRTIYDRRMFALAAFIVAVLWLILVALNVATWAWLLPLVLALLAAHFAFGDRVWRIR